MPELVLSGEMINMFTNPDGFRQMIATYNANKNARREYYLRHRDEILTKRKQRYAEQVRRRKESEDSTK